MIAILDYKASWVMHHLLHIYVDRSLLLNYSTVQETLLLTDLGCLKSPIPQLMAVASSPQRCLSSQALEVLQWACITLMR